MKKIFYSILWIFLSFEVTLAADGWVFWISAWKLRRWEIHVDDIPWMIKWIINFLLSLSWTIAIIFIILWAYKILFSELQWDKTAWKNTIIMAITWFAIASLAWVIIGFILDNFQA